MLRRHCHPAHHPYRYLTTHKSSQLQQDCQESITPNLPIGLDIRCIHTRTHCSFDDNSVGTAHKDGRSVCSRWYYYSHHYWHRSNHCWGSKNFHNRLPCCNPRHCLPRQDSCCSHPQCKDLCKLYLWHQGRRAENDISKIDGDQHHYYEVCTNQTMDVFLRTSLHPYNWILPNSVHNSMFVGQLKLNDLNIFGLHRILHDSINFHLNHQALSRV